MAWQNIPINHINFGPLRTLTGRCDGYCRPRGSAACSLQRFPGRTPSPSTFGSRRRFSSRRTSAPQGSRWSCRFPLAASTFRSIGNPSSFFDAGQTYSNDCVLALDPGSCRACAGLRDAAERELYKVVLLIRNIPGNNINANNIGVLGVIRPDHVRGQGQRQARVETLNPINAVCG